MGIVESKESTMMRQLYRKRANLMVDMVSTFIDGDQERCTQVALAVTDNGPDIVKLLNRSYNTIEQQNKCWWVVMTLEQEPLLILQSIRDDPNTEINPRRMLNSTAGDIAQALERVCGVDAQKLYEPLDVAHSILLDMANFYSARQMDLYEQALVQYHERMMSVSELISERLMLPIAGGLF